MKRTLLVLLAGSLLALCYTGCKKPGTAEPDPYTYNAELQSTNDACFAMLTVSDIEMCMAFVAEGVLTPYFYMPASPGGISVTRDTVAKYLFVSYNNVLCKDGKTRDGSIAMNYNFAHPNAKYYRDVNFSGKIVLINYKVNKWEITNVTDLIVTNQRSAGPFNPATANMSWRINGRLKMKRLSDNKEIYWDGDVLKTLANTNNPAVWPNTQSPIDWRPAMVQYTGKASGTAGGLNYSYEADATKPPLRDFGCLYVPAGLPNALLHPFTAGAAKVTVSNYHPRLLSYGAPGMCDNSGIVSFHGETYQLDFEP